MPASSPPDPRRLVELLADAGIDFVIVGGQAAIMHGSIYPSEDLDVSYARDAENISRLVDALSSLGGIRLRGAPPDLPLSIDDGLLTSSINLTLETPLGDLDLIGEPPGAPAYSELRSRAVTVQLAGHEVRVASLDDLISMKEAAGRAKDLRTVEELRVLRDSMPDG